jgi:hypothetical protein
LKARRSYGAVHARRGSLYIDRSARLKLLWHEPESDAVRDHVASEDLVIVSSLAESCGR